jgi:prophage regulatory protein
MAKRAPAAEEERREILQSIANLNAQAAAISAKLHADAAALAQVQRQIADLVVRLCSNSQGRPQVERSAPARMLRIVDVVQRVGLGRSTVWRMVQEKTFPAPRRLGPRAVAWVEGDVAERVLSRPSSI